MSFPFKPRELNRSLTRDKDAAVRATNNDAFESKIACMDRGYFHDNFLSRMKHKYLNLSLTPKDPPRRPPIINRGTFARVLLKQTIVERFLSHYTTPVQIISLGAGFDTFSYNLIDRCTTFPSFSYVEIDLPDVVLQKQSLAEEFLSVEHGPFKQCSKDGHLFQGIAKGCDQTHYTLTSCDLRELDSLDNILQSLNIKPDRPTLILAEIVLVYMEPEHSDALISHLGSFFTDEKCFINIEHVSPGDEFGKQMVMNIAARGSPLLGLRKYTTVESQRQRFLKNGWTSVDATTMLQAFRNRLTKQENNRLQRVEMLDEFEEFHMLMTHYCVVIAAVGGNDGSEKLLTKLVQKMDDDSKLIRSGD